jgi:hypothetical protein
MTLQDLAELGQLTVSIVGLLVIVLQIQHVLRSIHGTTQDSMYAHYTEVGKLLLSRPELRPYFYERKKLVAEDDKKLRDEIDLMSEAILGLIEHAAVQEDNLPDNAWRECWWRYAKERLEKGTELRRFFDENKEWYTADMGEVVRLIDAKEEPAPRRTSGLAAFCKS